MVQWGMPKKGYTQTPDHTAAIIAGRGGTPPPSFAGRRHSAETRARMSIAQRAAQRARSRALQDKTCVGCGESYHPRYAAQKYCGRVCADLAKQTKGGRIIDRQGYARRLVVGEGRYLLEHRVVMEEVLGRPLTADETVHHIDGDRLNNQKENLQLRKGRHGRGSAMRCGDCGSHNIIHDTLTDTRTSG